MEASLFGVLDVEGLQIQAAPSGEPRVRAGRARIPDGVTADPLLLRRCHRQLR